MCKCPLASATAPHSLLVSTSICLLSPSSLLSFSLGQVWGKYLRPSFDQTVLIYRLAPNQNRLLGLSLAWGAKFCVNQTHISVIWTSGRTFLLTTKLLLTICEATHQQHGLGSELCFSHSGPENVRFIHAFRNSKKHAFGGVQFVLGEEKSRVLMKNPVSRRTVRLLTARVCVCVFRGVRAIFCCPLWNQSESDESKEKSWWRWMFSSGECLILPEWRWNSRGVDTDTKRFHQIRQRNGSLK